MSVLIALMVWRLWLAGVVILVLNAIAQWVFKPTWPKAKATLKSLLFAPFWFLAIFSKEGRKILFNKIEKF